jgi:outer membrane protein TolC
VRAAGQWPNPTLEYRRENLGSPLLPDEFVTAYIPIDVTGRRVQLARATRRGAARALAERDAEQQDAALTIARAWVAAVLAAELASVTAQQHDAAEEIARLEAVRAAEGVSSEAAARRTRVEATRLAHVRALAEARAVQERGALATALGLANNVLPALPVTRNGRSALTDAALDTSAHAVLDTLSTLDVDTLRARALANRAELRASSLAREEASFRQAVERGGVLGDWQLQGGSKLTGGFFTGQLGLAVPIPLFHRNGGARERSAGVLRDADAMARTTALAVDAEVRAAHDALRRLRALGASAQQAPADADVIADAARVAYAEGHMTLLELLDAQRAAADARTLARQYAADLLLARLTLARAVGAPLLPGAPQ